MRFIPTLIIVLRLTSAVMAAVIVVAIMQFGLNRPLFDANAQKMTKALLRTKFVQDRWVWNFEVLQHPDSLALGKEMSGMVSFAGFAQKPFTFEVVSVKTRNDTTYIVGHHPDTAAQLRVSSHGGRWDREGRYVIDLETDLPVFITE